MSFHANVIIDVHHETSDEMLAGTPKIASDEKSTPELNAPPQPRSKPSRKTRISRSKFDRGCQDALEGLSQKRIMHKRRIGFRNILRAATGNVEEIGLNTYRNAVRSKLENFQRGVSITSAWVNLDGKRAELTASHGTNPWSVPAFDLSSQFPRNFEAERLFSQSCTAGMSGTWNDEPIYGDAYIVTDLRFRWHLRAWELDAEEVWTINDNLITPRTYLQESDPYIIFHEQPCWEDVTYLLLRFE